MENQFAPGGRPRLLGICTLPPWPVRDGYSLRVFHLLRELARDWSITLVAPEQAELGDLAQGVIQRHVPARLDGTGLTYPWRFDQRPLRAAIEDAVAREHPWRALVWPGAENLWSGRPDLPPAVLDMIDCNTLEFCRGALRASGLRRRAYNLRQAAIAAAAAVRASRSFTATVCVGEQDARWLHWTAFGAPVHVVPNGVEIPAPPPPPEDAAPTLSFVGTLSYPPNIEAALYAAREVWPRIRAAIPDARFVIAGRDPAPEVAALSGTPGVEVRANVPDMADVLGRSWVSIAPMRIGAGIKNKILEAWACGRPVVLTPTASNGLTLPPDHGTLVRSTTRGLAEAVVGLLADADARHARGRSALDSVRANATWREAAGRIDALLRADAPRRR